MSNTDSAAATPAAALASSPPPANIEALGKVESKIPGRMRVRLKPEMRRPEVIARLRRTLAAHPDVRDVTINDRTGSVVLTHKPQQDGHTLLSRVIGEAELLTDVVFELPAGDEAEGGDPYAKLDQQLADLMYKVEYAVYRRTGLRFRGQVVAGTLAGAGIAQVAVYGVSLEMLPGPLLIWVAWDIYHRVAKEPPFPAEPLSPGMPVTDVEAAAADGVGA